MKAYERYGIEVGQVYVPADGSRNRLTVKDVQTHEYGDDVVVFDEAQGVERRIDAFKLAKVRYCLVEGGSEAEKCELLQVLWEGNADPNQQRRIAHLFLAMQRTMEEQKVDARRGRFIVDNGEWRYLDDEREDRQTWLCVQVAPDADLSCKAMRASEMDAAICRHLSREPAS